MVRIKDIARPFGIKATLTVLACSLLLYGALIVADGTSAAESLATGAGSLLETGDDVDLTNFDVGRTGPRQLMGPTTTGAGRVLGEPRSEPALDGTAVVADGTGSWFLSCSDLFVEVVKIIPFPVSKPWGARAQ